MRIYKNGVYRDMTTEEIAELDRMAAEHKLANSLTLEEQVAELQEALDLLLSGVTE